MELNKTGGRTICQERKQLNVGASPGILIYGLLGFARALLSAGWNSLPGGDGL